MPIYQIKIRGFKSLTDVDWEPGLLNILIGPNGAGKSNILRALQLLSQVGTENLSEFIRKEGGMSLLSWNREVDMATFFLDTEIFDSKAYGNKRRLQYELCLEQLAKSPNFVIGSEYLTDPTLFEQKKKDKPMIFLERKKTYAYVFDIQERKLQAKGEDIVADEALLAQLADPINHPVLFSFKQYLKNIKIYQDIDLTSIRKAAVMRVERQVMPRGENLVSVLYNLCQGSREFKEKLDSAMYQAFGAEYKEINFPPAADGQIQLALGWQSLANPVPASQLSDGTLRFLMLITVLGNPNAPPLIAYDEPETSLHPSMFPIIAELAKEAAQRTQVIFATQSPLFLDAFSDVEGCVTVVQNVDGKTVLKRRTGDELKRWLEHYTLGELMVTGELEDID